MFAPAIDRHMPGHSHGERIAGTRGRVVVLPAKFLHRWAEELHVSADRLHIASLSRFVAAFGQ